MHQHDVRRFFLIFCGYIVAQQYHIFVVLLIKVETDFLNDENGDAGEDLNGRVLFYFDVLCWFLLRLKIS